MSVTFKQALEVVFYTVFIQLEADIRRRCGSFLKFFKRINATLRKRFGVAFVVSEVSATNMGVVFVLFSGNCSAEFFRLINKPKPSSDAYWGEMFRSGFCDDSR